MTCPHALPRKQPTRNAMTAPHLGTLRAQPLVAAPTTPKSHCRSPHLSTTLTALGVATRAWQLVCHNGLLHSALVTTPTPTPLCNWKHLCLLLSPSMTTPVSRTQQDQPLLSL
jgi:hypothetical protein